MSKLLIAFAATALSLSTMAQESKPEVQMPASKKCIDLIKMSDSIMMINKDCKAIPLEKNYTFPNGISVSTTGLVKMADGTAMQLKKGDAIDMNGKLMKRNKIKATF